MSVPAVLLPSNNLATTAVLSLATGAADASYPLANIADGDVTLPFKASAGGSIRIVFDCVTPQQVDGVFLPMHNIPAGTVVKWQGHTSSSWATPDVDVTVTIPTSRSLGPNLSAIPESVGVDLRSLYSVAGRSKRYWSLDVASFGTSPGTALAIGELLFGQLTDLWGFSIDDNQQEDVQHEIVKEAAFGKRWTLRYPVERRRLGGSIVVVGTELDAFRALYGEVGTADPFIWMNDPDEDVGLLVTFEKSIPRRVLAPAVSGGGDSVHVIRVDLIEVGRGLPL